MTQAEPDVQPIFSKFFSNLIVLLPVLGVAATVHRTPSRWPAPDRLVAGTAVEVAVGPGLRAWRLSAADRRFGGLSALAVADGALVALTDSGVVIRLAAPTARSQRIEVALHDLPAGPGDPQRKSSRDSESLLPDRGGRGWWVGFEHRHSLWLFDRGFRRPLAWRRLDVAWSSNRGAEALAEGADGTVMALPEAGGVASGGRLIAPAWTSDSTRLADGRLVVLTRRPTWRGFANAIDIAAGAGRPARHYALGLRPLDNMEGIAAEVLPGARTRLWIVSDDNFKPWMRTLLVAFDLPAGA